MSIEEVCIKALNENSELQNLKSQKEAQKVDKDYEFECADFMGTSSTGVSVAGEFRDMSYLEFVYVYADTIREIARVRGVSFDKVFNEYIRETERRNQLMQKQAKELAKTSLAAGCDYKRAEMRHDDVLNIRNVLFLEERERLEAKQVDKLPDVQLAFVKNLFGAIYYKDELSKVAGLGGIYSNENRWKNAA